ncbi:HK97 family phage prohead protease [Paracoccus aminovorans]|uniref:HK97 family phage prohead protease n=1 Tax=Paracoccus aminovorans TaxID=34004 RepID=UPI002B257552|nr:HK97 family phage prohead protease [Paracoccus aminovorans]
MNIAPIWPVSGLEVRSQDKRPTIVGRFPYKALATIADRGTVRKESIEPGAFNFSINAPDRDVHLLVGHSYDKPLASKQAGTLEFNDTEDFLEFIAQIPEGAERATHITDLLIMLASGLIKGVSPGFRVPPKDVVPGAEKLIPEPGNPGVMIRQLFQLVLYELSLVTLPAYRESQAELRALRLPETRRMTQRIILP